MTGNPRPGRYFGPSGPITWPFLEADKEAEQLDVSRTDMTFWDGATAALRPTGCPKARNSARREHRTGASHQECTGAS